jgi:hypothetical protein
MVLLAVAVGCSSPTAVEIGGVLADARHGNITITNRTVQPVYTIVIGRNAAAVADYMLCVNPQTCDGIAPSDFRTIPYSKLTGIQETEAIVHWYHLVPNAQGGFKPDSIRTGIVPLR